MDIRSNTEGLKALLGVPSTAPAATPPARSGATKGASALTGDTATLSSAGSEVSQTASESGVRADKVAAVQGALAAGTYNVATLAVAGKVVDAMLGGRTPSN